jgi:hypothetical protein
MAIRTRVNPSVRQFSENSANFLGNLHVGNKKTEGRVPSKIALTDGDSIRRKHVKKWCINGGRVI